MSSKSFFKFDNCVGIKYSHNASNELGGDFYYTTEAFQYTLEDYPSLSYVKVPSGFLTDGATIPRIFWSWASPIGKHAQACILHDYLCEYLSVREDTSVRSITRKEANVIFKESLLALGVSKFRARVMFMAVEAFRIAFKVEEPSFNQRKFELEEAIRAKKNYPSVA